VGITAGPATCPEVEAAFGAAFDAVAAIQARMSRFDATSDIGRFHALPVGQSLAIDHQTAKVLQAAAWLQDESAGLFDISLGTGSRAWCCQGLHLTKLQADVLLDLGGIAKGHAVDCAVASLQAAGCHAGWVNAGGDLRSFGAIELPVFLRDEHQGGVRPFGCLSEAAFASSHFGPQARAKAWPVNAQGYDAHETHVSVMAPQALWADALTKVVALSGHTDHPLLSRLGAQAWLH